MDELLEIPQEFYLLSISLGGPMARKISPEILYCGICHSDLHLVMSEAGITNYPIVPGHALDCRRSPESRTKCNKVQSVAAGKATFLGRCKDCFLMKHMTWSKEAESFLILLLRWQQIHFIL
ncbi:geraniol dehydrogenase 1-like [Ziziphus jujuba]|uniref:Geraniol dehydrogenase 1-like n=1 Tax=Ziziphus jujuba TaxID=326968 RepID=A0ABM4AEM6_ZIZJJ|nr:geraniol dehydrogenase 1-like [Ziziphus jujuba]